MPISYSFGYKVENQIRYLSNNQNISYMSSILTYWVNETTKNLTLKAVIYDVFGSFSEAWCDVRLKLNTTSAFASFQNLYNTYNSNKDLKTFQILSVSLRNQDILSLLGTETSNSEKSHIMNLLEGYNLTENQASRTEFYNILNDISFNLTQLPVSLAKDIFGMVYKIKDQGYSTLEQAKTASNIIYNLLSTLRGLIAKNFGSSTIKA